MKSKDLKRYIRLLVTGFSMGTADLIPGVSGGTIAFLSGIYQELLQSIKIVTGDVVKLLIKFKFVEAIKLIPFRFLIPLFVGLLGAILVLSNLLSFLLTEHPVFVWSFFFGLVLASVLVVGMRVKNWKNENSAFFVASAIFAYIVVGAVPVETAATLPMFFVSGMIAIVAMILPGISGSFILLLMGKYQQVLGAVTDRDFLTLIVFALGAVLGLALFSRALTWLFSKYHDLAIAVLAGFMLGSVRKLWPWKEVTETRINSHGEIVPLVENNILPNTFDASVAFALILIAVGSGIVLYLGKLDLVKEQKEDLPKNVKI